MRLMLGTVIVSFILSILLVFFCGMTSHRICVYFQLRMKETDALIRKAGWQEALSMVSQAQAYWKAQSPLLSMWAPHQSIDDVTSGLQLLCISIEEREKYHALLYSAEISAALSLIFQQDAFALKNIL